jgi:hypothetical protein
MEEETASNHRYIRMMVSPLIAPLAPAPGHGEPEMVVTTAQ